MATPTYDLLDSTTLGTSAASVTFSSISQDYRDLVVVISGTGTGSFQNVKIRFNGSTADYSWVNMSGDGSSPTSTTGSGDSWISLNNKAYLNATNGTWIAHVFDYAQTDKHKTVLARGNNASAGTDAIANRWGNTAAITTVGIFEQGVGDFATGTSFYLFGISA